MLTVTKTDTGFRLKVDGDNGALDADVTVTPHAEGVHVEFEFPGAHIRAVISPPSARVLANALLAALEP